MLMGINITNTYKDIFKLHTNINHGKYFGK